MNAHCQPESRQRKKNLVVVRAGDNSLHHGWISSPARDFDLLISYYGKQQALHSADADIYEQRPGPKWSCIADLLEERPDLIEQYEAFWFPDDDLEAHTETVNRMFSLFYGLKLKLAQPALTRDSFFSWSQLLHDHRYILRQVAFVEVMAPIFTRDSLIACKDSFRSSRSGWGLDWVWPLLLGGAQDGLIAVIDATPVKHTRPIGGGDLYKSNPELDPNNDSKRLAQKYGFGVERYESKFRSYGALAYVKLPWLERFLMTLKRLNARRLGNRRLQNPSGH